MIYFISFFGRREGYLGSFSENSIMDDLLFWKRGTG
jgi:hypothetical protein